MKIYYPIKPIHVNQPFGTNYNSFYLQDGKKGHGGIDFRASHGQKIYASHDGVCYPTVDKHGGNGVVIKGDEFSTIYWHLIDDDAVVHTNQKIKAGDLLGYADNTGQSTGTHLHFGFKIKGTPYDNGYGGYTDPQPYFNGLYAEDINNPPQPEEKFKFTKVLKMGSWNMDVRELQTLLASQGLYIGAIDGIFGKMTQDSVKKFQTLHGLVSDGIVGPKTNEKLNK